MMMMMTWAEEAEIRLLKWTEAEHKLKVAEH